MNEDLGQVDYDSLTVIGRNPTQYDQRMLLEMAYGLETAEVIRNRYGIDDDQWLKLRASPVFRAELSKHIGELQRNGTSFRAKAQVLAEDILALSHVMARDERIPAIVRLDAVKWLAKVSGLDESAKKEQASSGNNVQVNINLG